MVYEWCNDNLLTINCKKSQWMKTNIIHKDVDPGLNFTLGNVNLDNVNEYKYLGLTVDTCLQFVTHRDILINRVNLKIVFFRKIRKFITTDAATLIYKATILPILEYADFVFDHDIQYVSEKMQTIQNQALYTVYDQHYLPYNMKDSTEEIHRRCNLHRLKHRRKLHMLSFIYNFKNDESYIDNRDIRTRQREGVLFKINRIDHYRARLNPMYRAVLAWNELPVQIRNIESNVGFKKAYKASIGNPYNVG